MNNKNNQFDPKILSSCHINFLFGAGVNGDAFPQINGFTDTYKFLKEKCPDDYKNKSFEELFDLLSKDDKKTAREKFVDEFNYYCDIVDLNSNSIANIKGMLRATYKLVYQSENRIDSMNQINIYTTNYDCIIEDSINSLGYLCNSISASNLFNRSHFFNIVGKDYAFRRIVPTFLVSKIHGDIANPVLPGSDKYDEILLPNKFEIVFKMKENLSRNNSILFVIGYSGNDEHINRIINDCFDSGLTVYWFKFKEEDVIPETMKEKIQVIENSVPGVDTTVTFTNMVEQLWEESLEK